VSDIHVPFRKVGVFVRLPVGVVRFHHAVFSVVSFVCTTPVVGG